MQLQSKVLLTISLLFSSFPLLCSLGMFCLPYVISSILYKLYIYIYIYIYIYDLILLIITIIIIMKLSLLCNVTILKLNKSVMHAGIYTKFIVSEYT